MKLRKHLTYLSLVFVFAAGCQSETGEDIGKANEGLIKKARESNVTIDLAAIKKRDTLRAISIFSSTSYFLYRGEPMGYDYELAKELANHLGVELEMVIAEDIDDIIPMLIEGKGDIITYNLTVTESRREVINFTLPLNYTYQVLVQRKPDNWRDMKLHEIEKELIRNPINLIGTPIYVRQNSSYRERLENLEQEIGGKIPIEFVPGDVSTEEIIRKVSNKEINYTIADFNIASINASYYQNLDIQTMVGVMQRLAWATRKTSPELLKEVNNWLQQQRGTKEFNVFYNKYFKNVRAFRSRIKSDFFSLESNKISPYDELIKAAAESIGWDWRFLASQVYQESKFDPNERSWAGAVGLLQLMPSTAQSYGYTSLRDPEVSLKAGIAHIEFLNDYWKEDIPDSTERVKFILASYNAGQNHVQDARKLAEKYGMDPDIWFDNVEEGIKMKSNKKYFTDPVVSYGYCRGEEPAGYVRDILERYTYFSEFFTIDGQLIKAGSQ